MKKAFALILVLALCFGLCACNQGNQAVEATTEETKPALKMEDLAGTWSQSLWFLPTQLTINANGTYDYGQEKGIITLGDAVAFNPNNGTRHYNDFRYLDGYLYCPTEVFSKDDEYGLPFSPDENGRTEQEFEVNMTSDLRFDPAVKEGVIKLGLCKDGTFYIMTSTLRYSSSLGYYTYDRGESFDGTYKYQDSILTLTYEAKDYPLLVADGNIYYMVYTKN